MTPKQDAAALAEMLDEVDRRLPDGDWEVATSNSFRRINGPDGRDGGVLHALTHRDGQPDLSMNEEQLRFLCHLRNAAPAVAKCLREMTAENERLEEGRRIDAVVAETFRTERDAAIRERDEARERIDFMRHRYSTVGGRACAICVYENGRFIQACKLHEEFDAYNKAYDTLQTERDEARSERDRLTTELAAARAEVERLKALINTPRIDHFFEAVRIEAAHQVERWGAGHDVHKSVEDWVALFVRLLGKAVDATWNGDVAKLLHHVVTVAAVASNCHAHLSARLDAVGRAQVAALSADKESSNG